MTVRTPLSLDDVAPDLAQAFAGFQAASITGPKVDIVTKEMVRILSGQLSHCGTCRNLRVQVAVDRGLDETTVAKLEHFEDSDLSDRHKAALRYAKAFLIDPESFDDAARAALMEHFRADQIAELTLDLIRLRPGSKLAVASGIADTDQLTFI
jgi:alkylhydroperoxidase family enzyme